MRRMICLMTMIAVVSLLSSSCAGPEGANAGNKPANAGNSANNATTAAPAANAATLEAELRKMTTDTAASLIKNDVAAMEKVYAENYQFVGPDGSVANRTQRLDAMKSGDTKYESITYDDISVRTNPEGTGAIVISKGTVKGKNMGRQVDGQYRVTHVWSKTKDGWRMVNGQTTPLSAATKADDDKKPGDDDKKDDDKPPPPPPANK